MEQPRAVLAQYFDDALVNLLLADRACATKSHEICKLDSDPIWASQDPEATELKISAGSDSGMVAVRFRTPSSDGQVNLSYRMARTSRGWRIHDIVYDADHSLRSELGAK